MVSLRPRQAGYTYLLVLFLVAGLGLLAAGVGQTWRDRAHREREAELLAVGVEMARAIASYYNRSPGGGKQWPESLDVLVEDRRFPTPQRHLRRVYRDPFTEVADWGLVREKGRIVGIHSLSEKRPFRTHDLPLELGTGAENASHYTEWVFRPVNADNAPVLEGRDFGMEGGDSRWTGSSPDLERR